MILGALVFIALLVLGAALFLSLSEYEMDDQD